MTDKIVFANNIQKALWENQRRKELSAMKKIIRTRIQ